MNKIDEIREMIGEIGTKGYRDGSSAKPGRLYHPIPFDEFSDIRKHKDSSVDEYTLIKQDTGNFSGKRVLDIGCANGYFSFNIALDGAKEVVAYEGDDLVYRVDEEIRKYKNINNVVFVNEYLDLDKVKSLSGEFDIVIMLNVHMWIHKQLGSDVTKQLMVELRKKCKVMYFQTVHAKADGMYKIPEIKDRADLENYLADIGFTNVHLLGQNTKWGNRFMFRCAK